MFKKRAVSVPVAGTFKFLFLKMQKNEHFMFFWAQVSRVAAELVTAVSVHSCGRQTRFALILSET